MRAEYASKEAAGGSARAACAAPRARPSWTSPLARNRHPTRTRGRTPPRSSLVGLVAFPAFAGLACAFAGLALDFALLATATGFAAAPATLPLARVPFFAKDLFDVGGIPTYAGSITSPVLTDDKTTPIFGSHGMNLVWRPKLK